MAKRVDIKAILRDPSARRKLIIRTIIATQALEGIVTTPEQAAAAYDKVVAEAFDRGLKVGVCSFCQKSGIELIYTEEETLLQSHTIYADIQCQGSYTVYEGVVENKNNSSKSSQ